MHLHLRRFSAILVAVAFGSTCADSAVASPFGTQSPLASLLGDVTTAERPAIAAGDGRSLVVWREFVVEAPPRSLVGGWRIAGRLVDGAGTPVGDAFPIAEHPCCGRPSRPDVTYNAARDEFVVVWRASPDGAFVFAQRIAPDGALLGDRVTVRSTGNDVTEVVRVAWASDVDQYLVVWDQDHDSSRGCCESFEDVLALRLRGEDATPFPAELPLRLSDDVLEEDYPDVAYDAEAAKWLVAFEGELEQDERGESDDDLLGTTVTPEEAIAGPQLLSGAGNAVSRPAVVANGQEGGFVVAWSRQPDFGSRQSFDGDVVAQRFGADLGALGDDVAVSPTDDLAFGSSPGIAYDDNANEFLVVWWQELFPPRGSAVVDQVFGRRFSAGLAPLEDAQAISVTGEPETRGGGAVTAARQPVAAYDRSTCTYVPGYEITGGAGPSVASRGYDAPDCAKAVVEQPKPPFLSNRDSPVRGAETVTGTTAASLVATRCKSRRVFSIRLVSRRSRRYKSATVTVNGKLVKRLKGGRGDVTVDLEGLPAGTFSVRLVAKLTNGKTLRYTRRYRTCNRKLKPSNRLHTKKAV